MASQVEIMHEAGLMKASEAASLIGANHVGTIHRMVKKGALTGERVGIHWYVNAKSLVDSVASSETMVKRINEWCETNGVKLLEASRGKGKRSARK